MLRSTVLCIVAVWCAEALIQRESNTTYTGIEPDSCPNGNLLACGSTIDQSGTVVRSPFANESDTFLPSKECPWIVSAPWGHFIRYEISCFHHDHVNGTYDDCSVCRELAAKDDEGYSGTSTCSHALPQESLTRYNKENVSFHTLLGNQLEYGFSMEVIFEKDPNAPDPPTTTPTTTPSATPAPITTTSGASKTRYSSFLPIVVIVSLGMLSIALD